MNGFDATPYREAQATGIGRRYAEQHQTGPSTYFASAPMTKSEALHAPPKGMSHDDMAYDGTATLTIRPEGRPRPEFSPKTDVTYGNGIATDLAAQIGDAQRVAAITGNPVHVVHAGTMGIAVDLVRCAREKQGSLGTMLAPELALKRSVSDSLQAGRDVHIFAHSRGALFTQRALEAIDADSKMGGLNDAQRMKALSHVTVETIGGASTGFPPGVRSVDCVNTHDACREAGFLQHPGGDCDAGAIRPEHQREELLR